MATQKETIEYVITKLNSHSHSDAVFSYRTMFGEYALYCNNKTVGFVCDDTLYVKILPESSELEAECEQGHPYPGSKLYYVVSEDQLESLTHLSRILVDIANSLPEPKKKAVKKTAQ